MTENEPTLEEKCKEINKYQYAALGMHLLEQKNKEGAKKCLVKLLTEPDALPLSKEYKIVIENLAVSDRAMNTLEEYAPNYDKLRDKLTFPELVTGFYSMIDVANEKNKEKIEKLMIDFNDTTLGKINKEYKKAQLVLDNPELHDEEQKKNAEKTKKKYEAVYTLLSLAENQKMNELGYKVIIPMGKENYKTNVNKVLDAM